MSKQVSFYYLLQCVFTNITNLSCYKQELKTPHILTICLFKTGVRTAGGNPFLYKPLSKIANVYN